MTKATLFLATMATAALIGFLTVLPAAELGRIMQEYVR